jgi:AcrR family transcriptional regulator
MRDEGKRAAILQSGKKLFSERGFFNTSVSDIVKDSGLPVGTIYTYFKSKEEIVQVIVDEGWSEFYERLASSLAEVGSTQQWLAMLLDVFIPELLKDLDLIDILLTEAAAFTKIDEKLEKINDLVGSALTSATKGNHALAQLTRRDMKSIISVFFLGILSSVRLSRISSSGLNSDEIQTAVRKVVQTSLEIEL